MPALSRLLVGSREEAVGVLECAEARRRRACCPPEKVLTMRSLRSVTCSWSAFGGGVGDCHFEDGIYAWVEIVHLSAKHWQRSYAQ